MSQRPIRPEVLGGLSERHCSADQWSSTLSEQQNHLEGLLKHRCWVPSPVSASVGLERDMWVFISNEFQSEADAAGAEDHT